MVLKDGSTLTLRKCKDEHIYISLKNLKFATAVDLDKSLTQLKLPILHNMSDSYISELPSNISTIIII